MAATATEGYTDAERIELQRKCVAHHIALENEQQQARVMEETFATEGVYYQIVPGVAHMEGLDGVNDFYDMLFGVLPDIHITVSHQHDTPGVTVVEGYVTGTHSAEFAGVPASGRFISFPFCGLYIFGDDPSRLIAERAYWDNQGLISQMMGEAEAQTDLPWHHTK
jgi:steroid delta-isomerase-like uncharacterized protein